MRHGKALSRPMTPFAATAATRASGGDVMDMEGCAMPGSEHMLRRFHAPAAPRRHAALLDGDLDVVYLPQLLPAQVAL
jgi:hypothetical protein